MAGFRMGLSCTTRWAAGAHTGIRLDIFGTTFSGWVTDRCLSISGLALRRVSKAGMTRYFSNGGSQ
jgi:hypothetical protein